MSLVDDAHEITRHPLQTLTVTGTMVCVFCGHGQCQPTCVRHALPRIVAALEAAEHFVAFNHYQELLVQSVSYRALVAALRGEETPRDNPLGLDPTVWRP